MANNIGNNTDKNPEAPIIFIEEDETSENTSSQNDEPIENTFIIVEPRRHKWLKRFLLALFMVGLVAAGLAAYHWWNRLHNDDLPISVTPEENIQKLMTPVEGKVKPEVVESSDTILGVPLNFYALKGLRGSIEFKEPDTLDRKVFLYCRSADYRPDSTYIGTLVANGKEYPDVSPRQGYMAMLGKNSVVGISKSDQVKDFIIEQGGSFFRQIVLVSNGELPNSFELHGKVERNAIGRLGNDLYFITTRDRETLYDFADALREYGFIDAIYITGGDDYCFYRTKDGKKHDIGNSDPTTKYPHKKFKGVIPWLVFRK